MTFYTAVWDVYWRYCVLCTIDSRIVSLNEIVIGLMHHTRSRLMTHALAVSCALSGRENPTSLDDFIKAVKEPVMFHRAENDVACKDRNSSLPLSDRRKEK
jgi:hypothetical protein